MPAKSDWYRSSDWSEDAQKLFEEKLRRARSNSGRAHYMRAKAEYLSEIHDPYYHAAAINLINRSMEVYPEGSDRAYELLGKIYESDGDLQQAETCYRMAIKYEQKSIYKGMSEYYLGILLASSNEPEKMKEAQEILDKIGSDTVFLLISGRFYDFIVTKALLSEKLCDFEKAVYYAKEALLAKEKESQLLQHPKANIGRITTEKLELMRSIIEKYGNYYSSSSQN
jgi:tetratricopeptide (TPR) repeat protein